MYFPVKYLRLLVLFAKLSTSIAIVACFLSPMTIYREELIMDGNFEMAFNGFAFRARHHFCSVPEARTVVVNSYEMETALDLPNGTEIGKNLSKIGECRAKLTKVNKDLSLCMCKVSTHFGYIIAIVAFCISAVIQLFQIFCGWWKKGNKYHSAFICFCAMVWIFVAAFVTVSYSMSLNGDIWLPGALYAQSYFRKPISWSLSVGLCYIYVLLTAAESALYLELTTAESARYRVEIENRDKDSDEEVKYQLICTRCERYDDRNHQNQVENVSEIQTDMNENAAVIDEVPISYFQYSQSEIEMLIREPLPQPKLANFEILPEKPTTLSTWP